ncbi:MAG: hypothetical protein MSH08_06615 [Ezakiella sp.]|nr:hypothetical protein [Ezakiella sp.]MDD7471998.1 hypothetical protein [Bacillota bacterium]MDY3923962.1 hypothetical protein [Ezakiella sp.]
MKFIVVLFAIFSILISILEEKQKADKRKNLKANKDFDFNRRYTKKKKNKSESKFVRLSEADEIINKQKLKQSVMNEESEIKKEEAEDRKRDQEYKNSRIPRISSKKNNTSNNVYDLHKRYDCFADSQINNSFYKKNEVSTDKEGKEETTVLKLSDMQEYVVMKEILDKPVSLR